jgi:hypothetical protein
MTDAMRFCSRCWNDVAIKDTISQAKIRELERGPVSQDTVLREALERCRAWNKRVGNWSSEMEQLVDAALAAQANTKDGGTA